MDCNCQHCNISEQEEQPIAIWRLIISMAMLITGLILNVIPLTSSLFKLYSFFWYLLAYLPVGIPVMYQAVKKIKQKDIFSEFFLMSIATIGAFFIRDYAEGVAVMVFYTVGEFLQDKAIDGVKRNISNLLDIRPESVNVVRNGKIIEISPKNVSIGEIINILPGGRVPLDGVLINSRAFFNTAALTGESVPRTINKGEKVLAGMISTDSSVSISVSEVYGKSMLARILQLVQNASKNKAPAELFIRKFARIYTPLVIILAVLLVFIPFILSFFLSSFSFSFYDWFYRALTFMVVSCPCALVISIPLGYFVGIGVASKKGILFKGANHIDAITHIDSVIFDKTGTLTKGVFNVSDIVTNNDIDSFYLISIVASIETQSSHPIAKAIVSYAQSKGINLLTPDNLLDISGYGIKATLGESKILAGNLHLLKKFNIDYPKYLDSISQTMVVCALDGRYVGYIIFSDELKSDSVEAIKMLKKIGIKKVVMLSGDKQQIVDFFAQKLGVDEAIGDLLPDAKLKYIHDMKQKTQYHVIFVGDGLNDAPAIALSDVSMAMGKFGSDAAVEAADVVIQNDNPLCVPLAINVGNKTKNIIRQNVVMAIGVKIVVLLFGALGIATLWQAVFADVGVALLAILNAMRLYKIVR